MKEKQIKIVCVLFGKFSNQSICITLKAPISFGSTLSILQFNRFRKILSFILKPLHINICKSEREAITAHSQGQN